MGRLCLSSLRLSSSFVVLRHSILIKRWTISQFLLLRITAPSNSTLELPLLETVSKKPQKLSNDSTVVRPYEFSSSLYAPVTSKLKDGGLVERTLRLLQRLRHLHRLLHRPVLHVRQKRRGSR